MKISQGIEESGVVVGNNYDKYGSKNPIVKKLMQEFESALSALVERAQPSDIHEIGCGEGYWVLNWRAAGIDARGSDFSAQVISLAKDNASEVGQAPDIFATRSIYDITSDQDMADLIVCCEVLEHLDDPHAGMKALQRVTKSHIILSVPREPIWCVLNLARGKYVSQLGNTPGHLQHWSKSAFIGFVSEYFDIVDLKSPLPWTMVLAKVRQ